MNALEWVLIVGAINGHTLDVPLAAKLFRTEAECWAYVREHNEGESRLFGTCQLIEDAREMLPEVQAL